MKYAILASGSSGNASLVWTERHCLVVEAGIPMRRMLELKRAAGCILKPDAILVSHDHDDHAGFAIDASNYWHIPILCSTESAGKFQKVRVPQDAMDPLFPEPWDLRVFHLGDTFELPMWEFVVQSVPVPHVQGATGFVIVSEGGDRHAAESESGIQATNRSGQVVAGDASAQTRRLSIFTDLGSITDEIRGAAKPVHVLAIESNYSVAMMAENEHYHEKLKTRLMAGYGHLSNDQVEGFLASQEWPNLHTVVLIHLSRNNQLPILALSAAKRGLQQDSIKIACAWDEYPLTFTV